MSASHLPHAALAHHHGIHLVSRSQKKATSLLCPTMVYKVAVAGVALLLLMTVC